MLSSDQPRNSRQKKAIPLCELVCGEHYRELFEEDCILDHVSPRCAEDILEHQHYSCGCESFKIGLDLGRLVAYCAVMKTWSTKSDSRLYYGILR